MADFHERKTWFLTYSQVSEQVTKEDLLAHLKSIDVVREYVIGKEAHADGSPHFHAYVKYQTGVRPRDVLKFKWNERTANAEVPRNTRASMKYCAKDGDYITNIGNIKEILAGKKVRKLNKDIIERGAKRAIDEDLVSIMQFRTLKRSLQLYELETKKSVAQQDCRGEWYYGISGAGKTTRALEQYPDAFRKKPNKWWDGYDGQEVVILDDLRPDYAKFIAYHLTQWMDRHPLPGGEVKGGEVPLVFTKFIVTSQWAIDELFEEERDRAAIKRRCQGRITRFGGNLGMVPNEEWPNYDMAPPPDENPPLHADPGHDAYE